MRPGRADLLHRIIRCGGSKRVAAFMGLPYMETRGRKAGGSLAPLEAPQLTLEGGAPPLSVKLLDEFVWV